MRWISTQPRVLRTAAAFRASFAGYAATRRKPGGAAASTTTSSGHARRYSSDEEKLAEPARECRALLTESE
jgi:hypothetical protein